MRAYTGVTAHYIVRMRATASGGKGQLILKASLVGFLPLPGKHCGQDIAKALLHVTDRAKITPKILFITTDGASNMAAAMHDYEHLLKTRYLPFDSFAQHIVCLPHRLHVTVITMIKKCTDTELTEDSVTEETIPEDRPFDCDSQTREEALRRDPMGILHNIGISIRTSQLQRCEFKAAIAAANRARQAQADEANRQAREEACIKAVMAPHPIEPEAIEDLVPFRDCDTCWGSRYTLTDRGLYLREPIDIYTSRFSPKKNRLTPMEWEVLADIKAILEPAFAIQNIMCSEMTPVMTFLVPFFDGLIATWQRLRHDPAYSHLSEMLDTGIDKLVDQLGQYRFSKAAILSIVLNPPLGWQWLESHWPPHRVAEAKEIIIRALKEYDITIHTAHPATPVAKADETYCAAYLLLGDSTRLEQTRANSIPNLQAEFSSYCYSANPPSLGVNLVDWWQNHEEAYPRLFRMAMDYLPAQGSSVLAEWVFSSSAETDTRRRNRLSPHLMEQLQMLKFMLRKARLDFTSIWRFDMDDAELENEWIDRGTSVGAGDDDPAFYTLLDLLEQEVDEEAIEAIDTAFGGGFIDHDCAEVINLDEADADMSLSDGWYDE
ncbi:hypothetical protein M422DRAFT_242757 [Sphaerobolus stellatus SS14]|nr:hypothetical protein M422DRAFT_242757 [Sphaerobolus stellatus SS14]